MVRQFRVALLVTAVVATSLYAQDFKAVQSRFFPFVHQAVDVQLSRFGTFTAIADWTSGNSVSVLDENRELLWRHRQPYYWGGTLKHAPVLQFAPDESFLVFPGYRTDNDIAVVDPRTGDPYSVLTDHSGTVSAIALSRDGTHMLSYAHGELFLWKRNGTSFQVVDRLPGKVPSVTSLGFSPDGHLAAISTTGDMTRGLTLYRTDPDHLTAIYAYSAEEHNLSHEFTQLCFSPDGRWLAAGYSDSLYLWRVPADAAAVVSSANSFSPAPFQPSQRIEAIELGTVMSVRFSPDSALLFTGFYKDIRAYGLTGGRWQTAATFSPHQGNISDMAFSTDGKWMAIAGRSETNALGLWSISGVGPSPVGQVVSILGGNIAAGQKRFLDDAMAAKILAAVDKADLAPRDMFETEKEYSARQAKAAAQVAGLLQEETERHYGVRHEPAAGALYTAVIPLEDQGTYDIDHRSYSFRFMDEKAVVKLDREPARELYRSWKNANVIATRVNTPDGPTYGDFRLRLPSGGMTVPIGLSRNPFTGEKLDRYGVRVPSVSVGPDLIIRNLTIDGIFPSLYRYYAGNPLGHFELQNTGASTVSDLSVQFFVKGLTETPTATGVPTTVGVGQKVSADIHALFSPSILASAGGATDSAELDVRYMSQGKSYSESIVRPVSVLNRNAIRWTDDRKVASFMFVNDPALLRYSGQVAGMVDDATTNVLTRSLVTAIRMFEAVSTSGVRYVVDPTSPYATVSRDETAVDFVRFPVETLDQKGGDCDDLSVLYNSLLESVGVNTAYITTPGHIFTAFDLGMSRQEATKVFAGTDDLIFRDGTTWMPVETTLPDEGFTKAWQAAGVEWREAEAAGTANFFTTAEAWSVYPPAGFSAPQPAVVPPKERVVALFNSELDAYRKVTLGPRESELLTRIDQSPSAGAENQLGILYAQYGLFAQALDRFKRALAHEDYLPAMINAANVLSIRRQYDEARAYLVRAEKIDPNNAHVLISLAFSYFQTGSEQEARRVFERASRADPGLAARYPLFTGKNASVADGAAGTQTAGTPRAAKDSKAMELFGSEWANGK